MIEHRMSETPGGKQYDLEERTYEFARDVRSFVKELPQPFVTAKV